MLHTPLKTNKNSDRVAIIDNNQKYTYSELWKDSNKIAYWLNNFSTSKKTTVAIMLDNCYEAVITIYGCIISNIICVPIDSDMHRDNIEYIMVDSAIDIIVTDKKYLNKVEAFCLDRHIEIILSTDEKNRFNSISNIISNNDTLNETVEINENDTAFILYTTGTTGPRKGVMLSHSNLMASTKNINEFMKIDSSAVESLPMRLSHSFGFARLRCVLEVGGTLILENGFINPNKIIHNIKLYQANAISSVPIGFSILLNYFRPQFESIAPQIKYIEIGSSHMKMRYKQTLLELCPKAKICMHYGLTEASRSTFIEFNGEKNKLDSIGKSSPNVEVKISHDSSNTLNDPDQGEILIRAKTVMKGYLNENTKTNIKNDWLHTGDLGRVDSDGYIYYLGRINDVINVGGLKVAPLEIEKILLKLDGIDEVAVIGLDSDDEISGQSIIAVIVTEKKILPNIFEKFCSGRMESYKIPTNFITVDSLPKTSSGKIKRNLLVDYVKNTIKG